MISSRRNLDRELRARTLPERALTLGLSLFLTLAALASAQSWAPLTHQPGFNAGTALLLTGLGCTPFCPWTSRTGFVIRRYSPRPR